MQRQKAAKGRQAQAMDEAHEADEPESAEPLERQYVFSASAPAEPAPQAEPVPMTDAGIAGQAKARRKGKRQAMKVRATPA